MHTRTTDAWRMLTREAPSYMQASPGRTHHEAFGRECTLHLLRKQRDLRGCGVQPGNGGVGLGDLRLYQEQGDKGAAGGHREWHP
jgi:hypothetical protein